MLFILADITGMERQDDVITLSLPVPLLYVAGASSDAKDQGLFIKILVGLSLQFLSQQTTSIYFALLWKGILDHSTNLLKKFCPPHIQVFYRYMNKWEVNILKERDYISRSPDLTAERCVNADWESGLKEWSTFCIKKVFWGFFSLLSFPQISVILKSKIALGTIQLPSLTLDFRFHNWAVFEGSFISILYYAWLWQFINSVPVFHHQQNSSLISCDYWDTAERSMFV